MPLDGGYREREITTNSGKDTKCNSSTARHVTQLPSKDNRSLLGRNIVILRQRLTLGTNYTNQQRSKLGKIHESLLYESPTEHY